MAHLKAASKEWSYSFVCNSNGDHASHAFHALHACLVPSHESYAWGHLFKEGKGRELGEHETKNTMVI